MVEINGVAHIILTVTDWQESAKFYRSLLGDFLGLTCVMDGEGYSVGDGPFLYYVGGQTGIGIMQAKDPYKSDKFVQWRAGLHHVCFRVRSQEAVDKVFEFLQKSIPEHGGKIIQEPKQGPWAPGYRSVLFEDRDGIRIEFNFVPGKGLFNTKEKKLFAKM